MRKLKLFMTALALTGGVNAALAQTDVTSQYLTNADFEGEYTSYTKPQSDRDIYQPTGWDVVYSNGDTNDMTSLNASCTQWNQFIGRTQPTNGGSNSYWIRFRWGSSESLQLSQTVSLPAGVYVLSADAFTNGASNAKAIIFAGDNTTTISTANTWNNYTINFVLTEQKNVTLGFKLTQGAKEESVAAYDNFKLLYFENEDAYNDYLRQNYNLTNATYANPVLTDFVVNGKFDNGISPWQRTGSFQNNKTANNQAGAFTGNFYENWNGSAQVNKMYQTISNIPNGTYRLDIAAFVNTLANPNESQFVFANSDKTYLTTGEPTAYEVYTVVTNNQIEIGLEQTTATANWMGIDNVSLRYYGAGDVINDAQNASHKLAWEEAKAAAEAAIANADYANVSGSEKTALQAEIAKTEPTTADGYDEAAAALNAATATFTAAAPAYNELIAEIAYAQTIAIATGTAEAALNANATAATVTAATQELKVSEYQGIKADYPNDVTSMFGTWSAGNYGTSSGEGYDSNGYFDKWNGSAVDLTSSNAATLPAGKYAVMVAGRGVSTTTMKLSVKVGNADAVSTPFLMIGNTGKGIDTNGATNFSDNGTYSNDNNGRGWQYRYITFETDGTSEVTIAINGHLNASTWQSFYAPVILCDGGTYAAIALDAAKAALQTAIDEAPAVPTANVGENVFQIPANGVNTYAAAIVAAQAAHDATDATVESIGEAKTALETAIQAYNTLEINAPAEGQLFNVILTYSGWTYDQKAMTYLANGRTDAGLYNIQYKDAANPNLAQAFTFTKVEGNKYKMSQIDADGVARYISTGVPYGGNSSQIRTTTNADEALAVEVIPTATEGVWNLKNTAANQYIGSQDAGVYTVNSHIDFNLVETSKPSIAINTTAAGWGTTILPFAASIPEGVKVYTCAAAEGTTLTLVEVQALKANKPYIIEGSWNETLTGDAQGIQPTYTEGLLTGVYAESTATAGTYVMQKQDNKVGFFKVAEGKEPTIKANRCYMNAPTGEARAAYFFDDNETTGINAIEALTSGDVQIFNAAGAQLPKLQKGMNIIRKADGTSFKVMVK